MSEILDALEDAPGPEPRPIPRFPDISVEIIPGAPEDWVGFLAEVQDRTYSRMTFEERAEWNVGLSNWRDGLPESDTAEAKIAIARKWVNVVVL